MDVSYDPDQRAWMLVERGLDFADAPAVFAGPTLTLEDVRPACRPAGVDGVDADRHRHPRDFDEELP